MTGARDLPWPGKKSLFTALYNDDGAALLTISSNRVECWDMDGGGLRWMAKLSHAFCLAEVPGARRIVVSSTTGTVLCLDSKSGKVSWQADTKIRDLRVVTTADGRVAGFSAGGAVRVWSGKTGKPLAQFDACLPLLGVQKVPGADMPLLVTTLGDQMLCRFDLDRGRLVALGRFPDDDPLSVSPDGQTVLCLSRPTGEVLLRSVKGNLRVAARAHGMDRLGSWPAVWSPDGALAVFCGSGDLGHVVVDTGDLSIRSDHARTGALPPAFHPDGTEVCLCGAGPARILPVTDLTATTATG